jgi:hypothetical protein
MSICVTLNSTETTMLQEQKTEEILFYNSSRINEVLRGGWSLCSSLWILSQQYFFILAQLLLLAADLGWVPLCQPSRQSDAPGLPIHSSPSGSVHHCCCFNHINRFSNSALYQIQAPNYRFQISLPIIPPSV